jgi:dihydropyrimidine dehydrogenase (NAD+) subunit PreT
LWLAAPKEVVGSDGRVSGLVCARMRLGEPDSSGRRKPVETGELVELQVDMVIKAAGQIPYEGLLAPEVPRGADGLAPVFAGGDCVNGGKEVVDAVQAGKDAATAILIYFAKS